MKDKDIKTPDNRPRAEQHLTSLKRKFPRNLDFHEEYNGFMRELLEKGYDTRVPEEWLDCRNKIMEYMIPKRRN